MPHHPTTPPRPAPTLPPSLAQQAADIRSASDSVAFVARAGGCVEGRWFGGHRVVFPDGSVLVVRGGQVESPQPTFVPTMPTD